jgi:hypothetical protein
MKLFRSLGAGAVAALVSLGFAAAQTNINTEFGVVDAAGTLLPSYGLEVPSPWTNPVAQSNACAAFLALPTESANLPAGDYRLAFATLEQFTIPVAWSIPYTVRYDDGIQSVSPTADLGVGLEGVGVSLPIDRPDLSQTTTAYPCIAKVYVERATGYDSTTGAPTWTGDYVYWHRVQWGDGTLSDICGFVWDDLNGNGQRDVVNGIAEPGLDDVIVYLSADSTIVASDVTSDGGRYCFVDQPAGDYTISVQGLRGIDWSTYTSVDESISGCCPGEGPDFGRYSAQPNCEGRTPGYWSGPHGRRYLTDDDPEALAYLRWLPLVDEMGENFDPQSPSEFSAWLKGRSAQNMAYQLSGQLAAMVLNARSGLASWGCRVNDPYFGAVSVDMLINMAISSFADSVTGEPYTYTPTGHPQRSHQELLKNALDRANNNVPGVWN